ncbi:hypothetical protein TWF694_002344 [Orbilia ellipsospora]|uniref:Uncharacterized protein n=1 Tax=Orbilia ellipsospora TaxID=2528407 RepID=A0AAV9X488_9PEZI
MKYLWSLFAVCAIKSAGASPLRPRDCNADNCLRAIRASAFPTRSGTEDCSSYFRTTVTPAVVTVTSTNTVYVTTTSTDSVTQTNTIFETATAVDYETETDYLSKTASVTVSAYAAALQKRQQTAIPTAIPTYASACSGSVRYSSACSCIGVTATTITLDASTTVVYTDLTITEPASATITAATEFLTVTDATVTVESTDATLTITTVVATATQTNTVTLSQRFAIQIQGGTTWNGDYLVYGSGSSNPNIPFVGSSITNSVVWHYTAGATYGSVSNASNNILSAPNGYVAKGGLGLVEFSSQNGAAPLPAVLNGQTLNVLLTDGVTVAGTWVCVYFDGSSVLIAGDSGYGDISNITGEVKHCEIVALKAVEVPF